MSFAFFERGGEKKGEIGNPKKDEPPGKPDDKLSDRGFAPRSAPTPFFSACKKHVWSIQSCRFPVQNDHPGDYRASGCTAAMSSTRTTATRSTPHSTRNTAISVTLPQSTPQFLRTSLAIPSVTFSPVRFRRVSAWSVTFTPAQTCSPPISASPGGTTKSMAKRCIRKTSTIPAKKNATKLPCAIRKPPPRRGLWRDQKSWLSRLARFNKQLKTTQFADFHGHGWVFRGVYKHDRKGNWLDKTTK